MSKRIGLYGGSFDPIHVGHLISARSIAEAMSFSKVILIPSARPPHKEGVAMTTAEHRMAMVRLAIEGDPLFEASDVELGRAGPSFTLDTVMEYRRRLGDTAELFWIIGADSLPELPTWHRIDELVKRVTIVTAARPGFVKPAVADLAEAVGKEAAQALLSNCCLTPEIDISATRIRARVAAGDSIRYLTPEAVASYIQQHGLYATE